jgi:hypothetical protein
MKGGPSGVLVWTMPATITNLSVLEMEVMTPESQRPRRNSAGSMVLSFPFIQSAGRGDVIPVAPAT